MSTRFASFVAVLSFLSVAAVAHADSDVDVLATDVIGEQPGALALFDDGSVVVVGADGDEGLVVRLDATGDPVASVVRDRAVHDVAVDPRRGHVVIVDAAEVAVLSADLDVLWSAPLPPGATGEASVDVGEEGSIAVAIGGELLTFASDGGVLARATVSATISAVAVLDESDLVVAGGWRSTCDAAVDAPVLVGFATDGTERWRAFDAIDCDDASARIVDVARGEDGDVYALAEAEGSRHALSSGIDVAFDPLSSAGEASALAYFARVSTDGVPQLGQSIGFADPDAVVRPAGIAADKLGNVVVTGTTTHALEIDDGIEHGEALFAEAGFYTMLRSDFRGRFVWHTLERDDAATASTALALAGPRAVTLLAARRLPPIDDDGPASLGPSVLTWPTDPEQAIPKRPERDDVGTFGYESGVAGSDPTCYACGPTRQPGAGGVLALAAILLFIRPRRAR
jgi:hypothetical protein